VTDYRRPRTNMIRHPSFSTPIATLGCFLAIFLTFTSAAIISLSSQVPTESAAILSFVDSWLKEAQISHQLREFPTRTSLRKMTTISSDSNASGTGWVGIQALTAFFVIIAAVAFALFLRPSSINRSQYQPV
jgi:ABC-type transport system involved in multi-copper enzyme maturation permease subunit